MKLFTSLLSIGFTVTLTNIFNATPANAQRFQTYGQCITDLQQVGLYGNNAADRCFNQLQYEPPAETLAQCINGLQQAGFYGNTAADRCERLLAIQRQSSGGSPSGNSPASNNASRVLLNTNGSVGSSSWQSYSFTVNGNQTIRITVNGYNDFDPMLTLQDAYGNVIDENDDYGSSFNSQIIQTLAPGTYRAIVQGFDGGGNYNIVIQNN